MNSEEALRQSELLKAFAHPTRLRILDELLAGGKCVTDMEYLLPATQVNISQHLTILRHANLVSYTQEGAMRCYYLSRPSLVKGILSLLKRDHPPVLRTREQIDCEKKRLRRKGEVCGA